MYMYMKGVSLSSPQTPANNEFNNPTDYYHVRAMLTCRLTTMPVPPMPCCFASFRICSKLSDSLDTLARISVEMSCEVDELTDTL